MQEDVDKGRVRLSEPTMIVDAREVQDRIRERIINADLEASSVRLQLGFSSFLSGVAVFTIERAQSGFEFITTG